MYFTLLSLAIIILPDHAAAGSTFIEDNGQREKVHRYSSDRGGIISIGAFYWFSNGAVHVSEALRPLIFDGSAPLAGLDYGEVTVCRRELDDAYESFACPLQLTRRYRTYQDVLKSGAEKSYCCGPEQWDRVCCTREHFESAPKSKYYLRGPARVGLSTSNIIIIVICIVILSVAVTICCCCRCKKTSSTPATMTPAPPYPPMPLLQLHSHQPPIPLVIHMQKYYAPQPSMHLPPLPPMDPPGYAMPLLGSPYGSAAPQLPPPPRQELNVPPPPYSHSNDCPMSV